VEFHRGAAGNFPLTEFLPLRSFLGNFITGKACTCQASLATTVFPHAELVAGTVRQENFSNTENSVTALVSAEHHVGVGVRVCRI